MLNRSSLYRGPVVDSVNTYYTGVWLKIHENLKKNLGVHYIEVRCQNLPNRSLVFRGFSEKFIKSVRSSRPVQTGSLVRSYILSYHGNGTGFTIFANMKMRLRIITGKCDKFSKCAHVLCIITVKTYKLEENQSERTYRMQKSSILVGLANVGATVGVVYGYQSK